MVEIERPRHYRLARRAAIIHATLVIGVPSALFLVGLFRGDIDGTRWQSAAGLLPLACPAIIGFFGTRQPAALLVAAILTLATALPLFFFGFVLFLPAAMYFVAYGQASSRMIRPVVQPALTVTLVVILAVISAMFVFQTETICYETVQRDDGSTFEVPATENDAMSSGSSEQEHGGEVVGGGCGSETTTRGALLATVTMVLNTAVGIALTRPRAAPESNYRKYGLTEENPPDPPSTE